MQRRGQARLDKGKAKLKLSRGKECHTTRLTWDEEEGRKRCSPCLVQVQARQIASLAKDSVDRATTHCKKEKRLCLTKYLHFTAPPTLFPCAGLFHWTISHIFVNNGKYVMESMRKYVAIGLYSSLLFFENKMGEIKNKK